MLDKVEGFQWDAGNAHKNETHGVTQLEAEDVFFNVPLLTLADIRHSQDELRFTAMGSTSLGRLLYVTFTLRDNDRLIRVISARDMHRKERIFYAEETKTNS